jgi:DNA-binding winged helix-turn-helix (wHTH) protein
MLVENLTTPALEVYAFGAFRLTPTRRLLERAGNKVALGERALDLLIGLVEGAGNVISKRI